MRSTLFHLPSWVAYGGERLPLFGWGILLAVWAVGGAVLLAWTARREGLPAALRNLALPLAVAGAMILWLLPGLDDGAGVPIRGYGVMLLAAVAAGTGLAIVRGRRAGFDADTIVSLGTQVFLWGLVGARLFYVAEYPGQFFAPGQGLAASLAAVANVAAGGLVVFGSLPTAAAAAWLFARRRGLPLLRLADCIAPSLLVGLALGRLGCFLNGCCYGGPTDLPWGVRFPPESPPWFDQMSRGLIPAADARGVAPWSLPVHPAQLYAAIDAALLAGLALAYTPFRRREGAVFALVLALHPVSRLLLEAIRVDEPPALGTPLSVSQLISIVLLGLAAGLWAWIMTRPEAPAGRLGPAGRLAPAGPGQPAGTEPGP